MHSSTVLQRQVQAHPEIPPPPVSAGGTGAEAHLPTSRGKHRQPPEPNCILKSIQNPDSSICFCFMCVRFRCVT